MESALMFDRERETKNKVRYRERSADHCLPIVDSLYVAKFWACDAPRLTVFISTEERAAKSFLKPSKRRTARKKP